MLSLRPLVRARATLLRVARMQPAALYHENVIDHYENPRNVGALAHSPAHSPLCHADAHRADLDRLA